LAFFGCEDLPEQQQMLMVQKRDAPRANAKASQSRASIFVPTVRWIPYCLRMELKLAVRVENMTVLAKAATKEKRQPMEAAIEVTQLPHREQIAKSPRTTLAAVAMIATR